MTNMLQFLKRKIKPFKKCTGNPSYSFEINNNESSHQVAPVDKTEQFSCIQIDSVTDFEHTSNSQYNFTSKLENKKKSFSKKNRFYLKFKRSNGNKNKSESMLTRNEYNNNSLNNRESTNSIAVTKDQTDIKKESSVVFDSPLSSTSSNKWNSERDIHSYTDDDCINDLIDNTNYTQNCLAMSPNIDNSMVTYNTKYANNSIVDEGFNRMKSVSNKKNFEQQSTPFDESGTPLVKIREKRAYKRQSKVVSEHGNFVPVFRKSKTFQSTNELIESNTSPVFNKMDFKQARKCRRSNTTFTMAGNKKNKIIDYFNNLEIKPMKKNHKMFCSNKEIATIRMIDDNVVKKNPKPNLNLSAESKASDISANLGHSKNEVEKIQDLFFYDESMSSNRGNSDSVNMTNDKLILSTFLDSPVSVVTEKSSTETTPIFRKNESSKLYKLNDICSTNNSVEKFRRSSSMPGLIEQNLSIQANNSKINTLRDDDLNMNITPKKALIFDQNDIISNNSIENLSTPQSHLISSFEVSDDEPKPFVRGQSRNLSKNIKQMFKNVIKLQMNALGNLEKFYEAQLVKVEADRRQNLELNPMNRDKINEFFDKQLELLEERVQNNLACISKEKSRKMYNSSTSLKFENNGEDSDESVQKISKKVISQKLAQIISSSQTCSNTGFSRRSQSKNLLEFKNNLINQNNVLPSKHLANQSNDYSPKSSIFKRNLSLPFKQCKNRHRVRNDSAHELINRVNSPLKVDSFMLDYDSSIERNESILEVKKAHETSQRFSSNNMAKIVKLNKPDAQKSLIISANSAFKPIRKELSQQNLYTQRSSVETYEEVNGNESIIFKPSSLDVRRQSSIFYMDGSQESVENKRNMPMPRLSDSHLLFKIKQEKRMNENKRIGVSTYQKQYQSKITQNLTSRSFSKSNFHIETEV